MEAKDAIPHVFCYAFPGIWDLETIFGVVRELSRCGQLIPPTTCHALAGVVGPETGDDYSICEWKCSDMYSATCTYIYVPYVLWLKDQATRKGADFRSDATPLMDRQ